MNLFPRDWLYISKLLGLLGQDTYYLVFYLVPVANWLINIPNFPLSVKIPQTVVLIFSAAFSYIIATKIFNQWCPNEIKEQKTPAEIFENRTSSIKQIQAAFNEELKLEETLREKNYQDLLNTLRNGLSDDLNPETVDKIIQFTDNNLIPKERIESIIRRFENYSDEQEFRALRARNQNAQKFCYIFISLSVTFSGLNFGLLFISLIKQL
ncbi:MAG: hypothetical protein AAF298_02225 [Cyanobacteria bacterium P01_A01_bin.40]